jgi:hypothetical protein
MPRRALPILALSPALLCAFVLSLSIPTAAQAEVFVLEGRLEAGDPTVDGSTYGAFYDSYTLEGVLDGEAIRFEITGMGVMPYVAIFDASGTRVYDTHGVGPGYDMTINWQALGAGTYEFWITQSYNAETDYTLTVTEGSDLESPVE